MGNSVITVSTILARTEATSMPCSCDAAQQTGCCKADGTHGGCSCDHCVLPRAYFSPFRRGRCVFFSAASPYAETGGGGSKFFGGAESTSFVNDGRQERGGGKGGNQKSNLFAAAHGLSAEVDTVVLDTSVSESAPPPPKTPRIPHHLQIYHQLPLRWHRQASLLPRMSLYCAMLFPHL